MEIIKALAECHEAIKVDGRALYPAVSLHDFGPDFQRFGVQVAHGATVTFETERLVDNLDSGPTFEKVAVLTLKGEIRNVEKAVVAFLGTKIVDELLNL